MTSNRHSIAGIAVDGLFGQHNFRLGSPSGRSFDPSLLLFYGDNGSGKTTILRLICHTLSPESNRGHRSNLLAIPVKKFVVTLDDGTEIGIERQGDALIGPFEWSLAQPSKPRLVLYVEASPDGKVRRSSDPEISKQWDSFESKLSHLGLAVYFLSDDRKPLSAHSDDTGIDIDTFHAMNRYRMTKRRAIPQNISVLDVTVFELANLLRTQVLSAAQTGEESINQIYMRIVRRLLRTKGKESTDAESPDEPARALSLLVARSDAFSAVGLMPRLEFGDLIAEIDREDLQMKALIGRVLKPYIESISARLNALASVQEAIETFVRLLNEFYAGKIVTFDLREGLKIRQPSGKKLALSALSSGEKQLLLLFCATISARAQATIFVVDEPELSLNVKWQRQLLESLLTLVKGSSVQFVVATHSIELLAGHRDSIIRLDSRPSEGSAESWKNDGLSPS